MTKLTQDSPSTNLDDNRYCDNIVRTLLLDCQERKYIEIIEWRKLIDLISLKLNKEKKQAYQQGVEKEREDILESIKQIRNKPLIYIRELLFKLTDQLEENKERE